MEKQALIAVKYGSADTPAGLSFPLGTAHFLEHKMFEDEEVNMHAAFMELGAEVNAFTNFEVTAYYFTCVDNFAENLRLLLRLVSNPYFTDGNVEKEKGIIGQEISMYRDNARWRLYMNLLGLFHPGSPLKDDIAGTEESIAEITPALLYDCHGMFYNASNMALICAGDVDAAEVSAICQGAALNAGQPAFSLAAPDTSPSHGDYIEQSIDVSRPHFLLAWKDRDFGSKPADKIAASRILCDIIAGPSSELYEKMYAKGLTDAGFSGDYAGGASYGACVFAGASVRPEEVRGMVREEVSRLKTRGIDPARFEAIKRKHVGQFRAGLNSIERIVGIRTELLRSGGSVTELAESYGNITLADAEARLRGCFLEENMALSAVIPKTRG